ncbi:MAG: PIN domain-containing protein [Chloroflexota bacterium]|nr:PIN domain-containing protein [Chloroflexota bacterium]
MTAFVDTSALYALLDEDDGNHRRAEDALQMLARERRRLFTHSYVVVESVALVQRRLGITQVRRLVDHLLGVVAIRWVDEALHRAAYAALLASDSRGVSLVDHTTFIVMREAGIDDAFAFDSDLMSQGFHLIG